MLGRSPRGFRIRQIELWFQGKSCFCGFSARLKPFHGSGRESRDHAARCSISLGMPSRCLSRSQGAQHQVSGSRGSTADELGRASSLSIVQVKLSASLLRSQSPESISNISRRWRLSGSHYWGRTGYGPWIPPMRKTGYECRAFLSVRSRSWAPPRRKHRRRKRLCQNRNGT